MAYLLYVTVGLPVRYNWSPTEYEIDQGEFYVNSEEKL